MLTGQEIIRTEGMGISFGGIKAVSDMNMRVCKGQLVGLIGPNGAGKTTVFNLLTGIYCPTEGNIYVNGRPMRGQPSHAFVRSGVARTFQNIRLFKNMTVLENVMVPMANREEISLRDCLLKPKGYIRRQERIKSEATKLLNLMDLHGKSSVLAGQLPYGQQRQLEIVRAIATGAKALLLDEPAAGMNPAETEALKECIRMISQKFGLAVLLIEHHMSMVMELCEYIYVLDFGKTIGQGTPGQIRSDDKVISAYLGGGDRSYG